MTKRTPMQLMMAATIACSLMHVGCQTSEPPSTVVGGYTFSSDFDGERRVLRIEGSAERISECMRTRLPGNTSPTWKEVELDPALHTSLVDMLVDVTRQPSYEADTEQTEQADTLTCEEKLDGSELCYFPRVVVTGVRSPWYFGLHPQVTLSDVSQELVDEFFAAHEFCWDSGD